MIKHHDFCEEFSLFLLDPAVRRDLTGDQDNRWKTVRKKDRTTEGGISENAPTDFVRGLGCFSVF